MCECSLRNCGCQSHSNHKVPSCHQPSNSSCNCHQPPSSCNCHQQSSCRCQEQTVETVVPIKVEITPDISFCVEQADVKTEHKFRRHSPKHSPKHSPRHRHHSRKCDCYDCYRKSKRR